MSTVRMRKGDKYADIYDSPETIRQARREGYSLVESTDQGGGTRQGDAVHSSDQGGTVGKEQLIELTAKQLVKLGDALGIDVSKMTNKTEMVGAISAAEVTPELYEKYKA